MMRNLFFMSCILVWTSIALPTAVPPANTDCSNIIFDMMDCVPYLTIGSNETKPTTQCCSGFDSILHVNASCICEGMKMSADMGIQLNSTKAKNLPTVCGITAHLSDCHFSLPPAVSPVATPPESPKLPPSSAPPPMSPPVAPSPSKNPPITHAPAPAPTSPAQTHSSSVFLVFASLTVVSLSLAF